RHFFAKGKAEGGKTILNPAPAIAGISEVLPYTDIVVLNETELAFYAGANEESASTLRGASERLRYSPEQTIVVTLGAEGAFVLDRDQTHTIPGRKAEAVDTTGAGDCFVGALAAQLALNVGLVDAVAYANVAASLSVERLGAASSMPNREEVEKMLTVL